MDMVFVKPASGGRVRQPERQNRVMPEQGAYVPRDAHYERLIDTGDVIVSTPPVKAAAEPAPAAPAVAPEPAPTPQTAKPAIAPNSTRGRQASGKSEE